MRLSVRPLLMVASTLALALIAGCADSNVPTAAMPVQADAAAPLFSDGPDFSRIAEYTTAPVITIAWAKKWIGPDGGRLEFLDFAIDVPPGAVEGVTQFSIRLPVDPEGSERAVAEFGPHRTFLKPVAIEVPYESTTLSGGEATIGWWDPDAESWTDMGGSATADGLRLQTLTDHFSTFGTMEQSGDAVILSGG